MKTKPFTRFLLLTALLAVGRLSAQVPATADADFAALQALTTQLPPWASAGPDGKPKVDRQPTSSESILWMNRSNDGKVAAALKFMADHPADPRRWDAAVIATNTTRFFITDIRLGYDQAMAAKDVAGAQAFITRDTAARAAWAEKVAALRAELLAAPDAPLEAVAQTLYALSMAQAQNQSLPVSRRIEQVRATLAVFEQRAPGHARLASAYGNLMRLMESADPAGYVELLQQLQSHRNPQVVVLAQGRSNLNAAKDAALEMKFTAVDGREVDLAKLRGKVVLIDFWATWCGPCKAELPNVKAVYDQYHSKGFEVVAISLDKAGDRQNLLDYCKEHDLPWPQHFDGKFWQNEFAVKYAVKAIPAMFLLDQDGKVVSTNARGPRLGAEVKRLLKL